MIFTVKCLHRHQKVVDKHVEAKDLAQAADIGKAGCAQSAGEYNYISVEPFITWDKAILKDDEKPAQPVRVGA